MPFKVLIVGGAGGMGRWCARLFKRAGFDVSISSRRDTGDVASALGVRISRPESAGAFDIVVLSVPIDAVEDMAAAVAPRMKPGALLMDLSSLKKAPVESMLENILRPVSRSSAFTRCSARIPTAGAALWCSCPRREASGGCL